MLIVETSFGLIKYPLLPVNGLCGQWGSSSERLPFQTAGPLCPISSFLSLSRGAEVAVP